MAVNDNIIELIAKLDEDKSVEQIVKTDIPIIRDRINNSKALQIKCTIDKDSINEIKNQLKDIKINVGNISNSSSADVISQSQVKQIKEYNKEVKNATENAIALNKARMSRGYYPKIPYTGNTDKTLEVAKNTVNTFLDGTGDVASRVRRANEDATQSLQSFVVQVEKENGAIETLTYRLNKEARVYEYLGKTIREATNATTFRHEGVDVQKEKRFSDLEKIISQLKTAELYSTTFADRINELKTELASVNDTNGMNKFLDKLSVLNSDISATKAESQYIKSKIRDEERIVDLAKQEKEIRESAQHDYWQGQFDERIKAMAAENQVLKDMKKYYEELDRITRNFNSTKTSLNDRISTNISSLNSKTTNTTFRKNANNIDVQNQVAEIQSLISEYQKLSSELQTATTPEALVAIQNELDNLKPKLNTVNDSTKQLIASLNNNTAQTKLANGIKGLSASMNSYAQQNKKVINSNKLMSDGVTTFAQKWQELVTRLKSENLDENGLKKINQEFVVLKKEATASNLTTSAFFRNMRIQLSQVLMQWISLQGAIRITRSLMDEVINLDNAMVELRKVTEASDEEFEAFQKSAASTAKTLGASVSDVINATSVFSRAGFSLPEAEELGRVATLYKNVGDGITIDSAAESIISIMKAFNLEAKDSERIIDRINKVSNTFAVDSGGLGEALKRVSSAMASANNTLDETIALTTVANEIVQDPVAVAQAWRTVSMRIRAAKAELEDAGEDTEGMVESTAKLQNMIKSMTGVDIMVDKDTFKSTYDIIKELGAVWDNLKDIEQAQILEAIAGKRQANVVASALRNYEKLDDVLQTSIKSEGSAMQEQEEYSKSIQYSLDTLKAAYQEFANTVINNESTKKMFGVAQNFLEIITKIINKLGTFPTLMAGLGATLSITKGVGIFGVEENAKEATRQLTIFGKKWSDVKSDLKKTDASGITKIGVALDGVRVKSIAAQAGVAALNTLVSFGLSLAVSWAVNAVSKWVNKEKEAAEQAEQLRQEMEERRKATIESAKLYEQESKSIQDLTGQYIQLVSSTENLSDVKDSLVNIQEQIIEKYGLEADAIDLVNGKLEDNIGLLLEQEKRRNESWLTENRQTIKDAEDFFGSGQVVSVFKASEQSESITKEAETEARIFTQALKESLVKQGVGDLFKDTFSELENLGAPYTDLRGDFYKFNQTITLREGLDAEQTKRAIDAYVEAYKQLMEQKGSVADYFDLEGNRYDYVLNLQKQVSDYYDTIQTKQQMLSESESLENLLSSEDLATYESTIKSMTELNRVVNDSTKTPAQQYGALQNLYEQEDVIKSLIDKYPVLSQYADSAFKNMGLSMEGVVGNEEVVYERFKEQLNSVHKDALDNISKIESAMVSAVKGEGLNHSSAWDILNLDTNNLLGVPSMDGSGNYHIELENLISLKDDIIEKNKILIQQDLEESRIAKQNVDKKIQTYEREYARINSQIARTAQGNSRPSQELVATQSDLSKSITQLKASSKAYGDEIQRDTTLIREYDAHLGNLANTQNMLQAQIDALKKSQEKLKTELDNLNKSADNLLKAQEYKIDQIIDKFQDEKDALEENKKILEEQLDALEQQKQQIEDIIKNYDNVADVISATVKDQVDEIKKNQDEVEKYYNDLIDKLKDENSERKDALDYAEKLAALENAKKNKVRVYGAATGWGYAVDRDALTKAQEALKQADDDKAIKELERERDERVKAYDDQIKGFEAYADEWSGIKDLLDREEKERLADELLGSEWREKIRNKDVKLLNKFKNEYRSYNNQLSKLVNGEIATLKKSIESVDAEIAAKQKTIDTWNKYKKSVQDAATAAKNANEDYMKILDQVTINEASDLKARDNNLNAFKNHYIAYMNAIGDKSKLIDDTTNKIEALTNQIAELSNDGAPAMDGLIDYLTSSIETIALALDAIGSTFADSALAVINGESYRGKAADIVRRLKGYKDGGSVDFTGVTTVHGTPNHSETIFSSSQSKELYDLVRTGKFATQIENRVMQGLNRALKSPTSTSNSTAVNISNMTIKADNPQQFHSQFMKEIHTYMDLKLNESYVK